MTNTSAREIQSDTERMNRISNKYGYFDRQAREFVITRPDTPLPWVNYITNGKYSGIVSHTGGGYSFFISPRDCRISRWRYNSLPQDRPGRYLYLRDRQTGAFWSPTWQPTPSVPLTSFQCRHGMNYTAITTLAYGIEARITYFVTRENMEVWRVRIRETEGRSRSLDVYSFVELALGHALVDLINQPNDKHFNEVRYLGDSQILMATKRYWVTFNSATVKQANQSWRHWAFMASTLPVAGFDGSRDRFIGPWRSEENPIAVEQGVSFNTEITAGDAIASLRSSLEIPAHGEKEFCIFMGVVPREGEGKAFDEKAGTAAAEIVERFRIPGRIGEEFRKLVSMRDDYLSSLQIDVPDPEMNLFINFWNQYQTKTTYQFSRDASYHPGGLLFGRGYRDSCQDALGPLFAKPGWVKERIGEMAGKQFQDGSVYHCYYPLTGGGERTGHSDTPLWLPMIVIAYLKETGDFSILEEIIPFVDGGEASLLEHIERAAGFIKSKTNEQNLVYIGPGDWNDTLDYCGREGKGISSLNSFIYAFVLREMAGLHRILESDRAVEYQNLYDAVKASCNQHLWDGKWYIRAINDLGEKIGSLSSEEGKIFINAQSWAVISGVAEGERAARCMDSALEMCSTPKGLKILHPPYTRVDPHIGLATRCVPGKKENGAVFNHAFSWAILALLILKRAEKAHTLYHQALPIHPSVDIDRYEVEPYVYSEYVTSPDHPSFGQASHSWLTGSSVWMLRNTTDYLLGIRPEYNGLLMDPCIPSDWKEFSVTRRYRGDLYNITFRNPGGGNGRVISVILDGDALEGNLIPPCGDGKPHEVIVILGN